MTEVTLTNDELTLLRGKPVLPPRGQYLSVAPRTAVFAAQVNGAPVQDATTLGYYAVPYNNITTGAYTAVEEDMTVDFGTTPGARDIGSTRVRWRAADASYVYITESAPGKLPIVDDCYITVVNEFRPWMVLPRGVGLQNGVPYTNDLTLFVDYDLDFVAAGSPNIFFRPKANITRSGTSYLPPKPAGFVDGWRTVSQQIYRTVTFSAWQSFDFSTGVLNYGTVSWNVDDGTITVGTSSSETITARFPVGFRYIHLTVTSSNGVVRKMHYPIWVHDETYMPLTRFFYNRNSTREWREMELEFFAQDTSETVIPRGSALCYWKIPYFSPVPEAYRDQFLAWAREDTTLFRKYQSRNMITLVGLGWWLDYLRNFPLRVYNPDPAAVDTWFEMYDITLNRLLFYILEYFTTATRIANFYPSDISDLLKSLDITGETVWQQLKYTALGKFADVRTDSLNTVWTRRHFSFLTEAERAAITPLLALTPADWTHDAPPKIMRRDHDPIGYVVGTGAGLNDTTNVLYKASAPGRTPDEGAQSLEAPFQNLDYATAQDDLNWLTGQFLAHENNDRSAVPFDLIYPLDVIEPAWAIPITVTDDNSDSGLAMSADYFLVDEVNLTYAPGDNRERVTYTTQGVTLGAEGQMEEVIVDEYTPPDTLPPDDIVLPPVVGPTGRIPAYTEDMLPTKIVALAAASAQFAYAVSWNPLSGTANWVENSTGLGSGYGLWLVADPYDYRRYFALMSDGLYVNNNPKGGSSWSLVADNAAIFGDAARIGKHMEMSINRKGYIAICTGTNTFVYSTDYGATWNVVSINGAANNYGTSVTDNVQCKFSITGFNNGAIGHIHALVFSSNFFKWRDWLSEDWGATWTVQSGEYSFNGDLGIGIIVPYKRAGGSPDNVNDGSQEVFGQSGTGHATNAGNVLGSVNEGVTWSTVYTAGGGPNLRVPAGTYIGRPIHTFTYDSDYLSGATLRTGAGGVAAGVYTTKDGGATIFSNAQLFQGAKDYVCLNGSPVHREFLVTWARDSVDTNDKVIYWTDNFGTNWHAFNPPTFFTGDEFCANVQIDISDLVAPA